MIGFFVTAVFFLGGFLFIKWILDLWEPLCLKGNAGSSGLETITYP